MINDELIRKAARAAQHGYSTPFDDLDDWEREKLLAQTRAALEAVAADIWDEGHEAGESSGFAIARDDWDDLPGDTNPYRNEYA